MPEGRSRREILARRKRKRIFRAWGHPRADLAPEAVAELVAAMPRPEFEAD